MQLSDCVCILIPSKCELLPCVQKDDDLFSVADAKKLSFFPPTSRMHCCSSLHFSSDPSLILLEASEAGAEDGASSVEVKNIAEENISRRPTLPMGGWSDKILQPPFNLVTSGQAPRFL